MIVAGVAVTGGAWYTGKRLETQNQEELDRANAQLAKIAPQLGLRLEQRGYERGVFSSHTQLVLHSAFIEQTLAHDATPEALQGETDRQKANAARYAKAAAEGLVLDVAMEHGPFPWSRVRTGQLKPVLVSGIASLARNTATEMLFDATHGASPYVARTSVDYNGRGDFTFDIPPANKQRNDTKLVFSGMHGAGTFDKDARKVSLHAAADSIKVTDAKEKFDAGADNLVLDLASQEGKFGLGTGESSMEIGRLYVEDANGKSAHLVMDKVGYHVKLGEDDKTLFGEAGYRIAGVVYNKIDLGSPTLTFKFKNIDGQTAKTLSEQYRAFISDIKPDAAADGKDFKTPLLALMGTAQQLLAASPNFSIDPLSWKTAKGEHTLTVSVDLGSIAMDAGNAADTVLKTVKHLDATVRLSKAALLDTYAAVLRDGGDSPQAAAERAEEEVASTVQVLQIMNLVKIDGDAITGHYSYADGVLDINGNKRPAKELISQFGLGSDDMDEGDEAGDDDDAGPDDEDAGAPTGLVTHVDPENIVDILNEAGLESELGIDPDGDPLITIDPTDNGARSSRIEFYDCSSPDHCSDIELKSIFTVKKPPANMKTVNDWNRKNRWVRAYVDNDGSAVLEADVTAAGGISEEGMRGMILNYLNLTYEFSQAIGATSAPSAPAPVKGRMR